MIKSFAITVMGMNCIRTETKHLRKYRQEVDFRAVNEYIVYRMQIAGRIVWRKKVWIQSG